MSKSAHATLESKRKRLQKITDEIQEYEVGEELAKEEQFMALVDAAMAESGFNIDKVISLARYRKKQLENPIEELDIKPQEEDPEEEIAEATNSNDKIIEPVPIEKSAGHSEAENSIDSTVNVNSTSVATSRHANEDLSSPEISHSITGRASRSEHKNPVKPAEDKPK